jgi:tetratricopeptide (TPR) repeat protein
MLFEALTGQLPFHGAPLEVLGQKLAVDAPEVRALAPAAPSDLAALCMALLAREPADRPDDDEVLALLGGTPTLHDTAPWSTAPACSSAATASSPRSLKPPRTPAIRPYSCSCAASPASASPACWPASSPPRSPRPSCTAAVTSASASPTRPSTASSTTSPATCGTPTSPPSPPCARRTCTPSPACSRSSTASRDRPQPARRRPELAPHVQRQRAFEALRALLANLVAAGPVVLAIDDFHWADGDSVALLRDVLRAPDAPAVLLIVGARSDADAACVDALRTALSELERREIDLPPLTAAAARSLAVSLLGPHAAEADAIVHEAEGNPLLLTELCHFVRNAGALARAPSWDAVLRNRVARLHPDARNLLAVVALATQPIDPTVARAVAARLAPLDLTSELAVLRREHLIRSHSADGQSTLEVFHDRVRDAVAESLTPAEQRAIHLALAATLEAAAEPDSEALHFHLEAAGETARAAEQALRAAAHAREALAFDRAAALYRRALVHAPPARRPAVLALLGDVLASDGRGSEAADAYEQAADALGPHEDDTLDLLRRAGFERLRSGQIDAGLAVLQKVLAGTDLRLAPTRTAALLSLVRHRVVLGLRGLHFHERPESDVPARAPAPRRRRLVGRRLRPRHGRRPRRRRVPEPRAPPGPRGR